MRALVTGATGFVGSTLCEELNRRGFATKALVRRTSSMNNLLLAKFTPVEGDLRDPESLRAAVQEVDVIFHVAGLVAARSREHFFESNAAGTKNLVEAARKYGKNLQRFVYVSSLAAAGPSTRERVRLEGDESRPVSDYGASKLEGERVVLAAGDFPVSVVRPPAVYGPRDKGVFTFFQAIQRGILPLLGTERPDPRRYSFVHVDDLVQGIVLAGTQAAQERAEIFYVAGSGEYSWEEAMRLMAKALNKNAIPVRLPIFLMKGAAGFCSAYTRAFGKVLPFSLDKVREIEAAAWTCSNARARKVLGFAPYWELEKGLEQTARWYRENGWLGG